MSLSSLCVQVLLSVWTEAAEAMPAIVAGWLASEGKSRAVVAGWLDGLQEEKSRCVIVFSL